jgi:hypothetical protein
MLMISSRKDQRLVVRGRHELFVTMNIYAPKKRNSTFVSGSESESASENERALSLCVAKL